MFDIITDILCAIIPLPERWRHFKDDDPPMTTKQKVLAIALIILGGFVALAVVLALFILTNQ